MAGNGSVNNPYIIRKESDFDLIRNNPAKHFVLGSDVTMANPHTAIQNFTGSLNGQGYAIRNFTYDARSNPDYMGFFSRIAGRNTRISNLTIDIGAAGCLGNPAVYSGTICGAWAYNGGSVEGVTIMSSDGANLVSPDRKGNVIGYMEFTNTDLQFSMNEVFILIPWLNTAESGRSGSIYGYNTGDSSNRHKSVFYNANYQQTAGGGTPPYVGTMMLNGLPAFNNPSLYTDIDMVNQWEMHNGIPRLIRPSNAYDGSISGVVTLKGVDLPGCEVVILDESMNAVGSQILTGNTYSFSGLDKAQKHCVIVKEPTGAWEYRIQSRVTPV